MTHLLERHELRRARRPDAGTAVGHRPPGHRELAEVMPDHLRLDFDGHEFLPVVDRDLLPDEIREDRYVAAVRPHGVLRAVRPELLDEREALPVDAAHVRAAGPPRGKADDLPAGHRPHLLE